MKQIKIQVDREKNIIIATVIGSPNVDDYKKVIKEELDKCPPKLHVWDYAAADLSVLFSQELEEIMRFALSHPNTSIIEKVALILTEDLSFGLGRMLDVFGEMQGKPFELELFRNTEEAFQWIGVEDIRKEDNKP